MGINLGYLGVLFCFLIFIYVSIVCAYVWKSGDNLWKSFFSFYHVGPGNQTQASGQGSECLYTLSHLASTGHCAHCLDLYNLRPERSAVWLGLKYYRLWGDHYSLGI